MSQEAERNGMEENAMQRRKEVYRIGTTAWKSLWTWIFTTFGVGAAVLEVKQPETLEEFLATWPAFVCALIPPLMTALENFRKNYRDDGQPVWSWPLMVDRVRTHAGAPKLPIILLAFMLSGCATSVRSQFIEQIADPETGEITTTTLDLKSKAGMFAELDTTNQNGAYTLDEEGKWILTLGLDAQGLRNTGQIEALSAAINGMAQMNAATMALLGTILESRKPEPVPIPAITIQP